ncbi:RNA polymerase II subunit A C-terminal domain phosphatase SSU72 isoform X1 [Syngnathoides biaculeatus]|uniref:RNA polymerase II subunit A C-terminal domain phosphatase SSU72 isoform X1 n=1 Tax=Syngnathoides biaculeatus TaxID=300417 RepID=UPI002ADD82F5|nr:RNA polymerase II subunit A C-terminal domain phosphatase SSU72 isoform X1 [Syngnathoides biaculeatus]
MPSHPLRVAVVCSSNQNRSMEAHNILSKRGFDVRSFGTGSHVKLPGPAPDKPNVYDFKTTYEQMYNDLVRKDKELYTQNGILHMLDRNKRIKSKPERFQSCRDKFDLVITCEERVYDQVLEDLSSREQETMQPVHVINVDIQDNHEEATLGAFLICELCQCFRVCPASCPLTAGIGSGAPRDPREDKRSSTRTTWRTRSTSSCRSSRTRAAGPSSTRSASTDAATNGEIM